MPRELLASMLALLGSWSHGIPDLEGPQGSHGPIFFGKSPDWTRGRWRSWLSGAGEGVAGHCYSIVLDQEALWGVGRGPVPGMWAAGGQERSQGPVIN